MDILGYIQDNYVWIIIVAIVIIMTIIGYVAEKKDFGNTSKEKKIKQKNEEKREEVKIEEISNQQPIEEMQNEVGVVAQNELEVNNQNEDLLNSFDMNTDINEDENIEQNLNSGVLDSSEGMYNFEDDNLFDMNYEESDVENANVSLEQDNSFGNIELSAEEVVEPKTETFELEEQKPNLEEITELEDQNYEEIKEASSEYGPNELEVEEISELPSQDNSLDLENLNSEENNDLEIELPNIDTLNEEIKDVIDEDDVWKF